MGIKNGRSCAPAILCTDLFLCLLSDNFKILIFNFGFSISSVFFCKCTISVGLSMMCYRLGKVNKTCLGECQLRGRIGKLLYMC